MTNAPPPKKILFVCSDNAFRSQIAEALARMYGGNAVEVFSAGLSPAAEVDPQAVDFMADCGYDLEAHFPKSLGDIPPDFFDAAVWLDCGSPDGTVRAGRRLHWEIGLPESKSPEECRAIGVWIESRVRALLTDLSQV